MYALFICEDQLTAIDLKQEMEKGQGYVISAYYSHPI